MASDLVVILLINECFSEKESMILLVLSVELSLTITISFIG